MQCPECTYENRFEAKFCGGCGTMLEQVCPNCNAVVLLTAKFCDSCGAHVGKEVTPPRSANESLPEGHVARVGSEAERRQLTVMFCDLVGSTALAERLDPEELRELLAQYQELCANVINKFEGYLARYIGDGLLVYFGYPQAHEDDPQRAVRAGLEIVQEIQTLGTKVLLTEVTTAVRIGITTGLVVVGDIGSGEQREEMAVVGETPNIAARLQTLAEPNTVVIGASTKSLVEGLFECKDLGPQNLKGISKPLSAFHVIRATGVPSRFEASAAHGLTPLVGREEEISLILKRWEQVIDGESQVVLLSGEAGIGKSRIVKGFQERITNELGNRVLYYCSPYYQNSAFYPLIDQLERALRFEKNDSNSKKLDKLEAVLSKLGLSAQGVAPILANLMSLPGTDRYPELTLSPLELKQKALEAIINMIRTMAAQNPVLMVVEDAHWIDPSTKELISLLIEQGGSTRVLLLITHRPEFTAPWIGPTNVTALTLNRLSRKECMQVIARVTQDKALPLEVLEQIVAKTDGVPLFVEELTKNMLESGLLEEVENHYALSGPLQLALAIPASLHDSLMARLDRLAQVKEIAQLAAALGRSFSHELLVEVSELDEKELQAALEQLIEAELLFRRNLPPNVTYEFKHALVQDAAYQSLLKSNRQQYHQRIAHALEKQFPETAGNEPEVLAHHFTEAGLLEQAIDYWQQAGHRECERSANVEAIAHCEKGLALVNLLPESRERDQLELSLQIALGPALMTTKGDGAPEVAETYARARQLCLNVGDPRRLFATTWGLWLIHQMTEQIETARLLTEELQSLAHSLDDTALELQAQHASWTTLLSLAELNACRDHALRGIALYEPDRHHGLAATFGGHDAGVCARNHAAHSSWFLGFPDQALKNAEDAIALADKLAHPSTNVSARMFGGWLANYLGDPHLARQYAQSVIAMSADQGVAPQYAVAGQILSGWALAALGKHPQGIGEIYQGLAAYRAGGNELRRSYFLSLLAEAHLWAGQTEEGLCVLSEALDVIEASGERRWQAELRRLRGAMLLARNPDDRVEVESNFTQALEVARQQSAKSLELRAATSLAHLWGNQGKTAEARDLLTPIYDWFTEGFNTTDLREAKALLVKLN